MKCKWNGCSNDARAKSPFCSGTCKKRSQRASGTDVLVEVGHITPVPVGAGVFMPLNVPDVKGMGKDGKVYD